MKLGHSKLARLEVKQKTGFRNITGGPIVLLDERGILFYDTSELTHRTWEFNLPEGIYYILAGKFTNIAHSVVYPLSSLPKPERMKKHNPENFPITFTENPFTGSVFWDLKNIYLDNSLMDVPIPDVVFVLCHEYAHRYYKTEHYCDLYAKNEMLKVGYNPSQIGEGVIHTLSENNFNRQVLLIDSLI